MSAGAVAARSRSRGLEGRAPSPWVLLSRVLGAELRKAMSLPATWVALTLTVLGTLAVTVLNARLNLGVVEQPAVQAVFDSVGLGAVGAAVLGVVRAAEEYATANAEADGGGPAAATMLAVPRRSAALTAKALSVVVLAAGAAAVTVPVALVLAHARTGEAFATALSGAVLGRWGGLGLYWVLTALVGLGFTVLCRSAVVPLVVLIGTNPVVTPTLLLAERFRARLWLPDAAGLRLFSWDAVALGTAAGDPAPTALPEHVHLAEPSAVAEATTLLDQALAPLAGGLVMAAWAGVLLVVAGLAFVRRDA